MGILFAIAAFSGCLILWPIFAKAYPAEEQGTFPMGRIGLLRTWHRDIPRAIRFRKTRRGVKRLYRKLDAQNEQWSTEYEQLREEAVTVSLPSEPGQWYAILSFKKGHLEQLKGEMDSLDSQLRILRRLTVLDEKLKGSTHQRIEDVR